MSRHSNNGIISVFENVFSKEPLQDGDILRLLDHIKSGFYKEIVEEVRQLDKESKLYKEAKKQLPAVTISGTFRKRLDSELINHSGFICMDFDNIEDVNSLMNQLSGDEYTFGVFRSISGKGVACIVKISKAESHKEYFKTLREYYREKYRYEVDPSCINVSRLRIISYDPETYINTDSKVWAKLAGLKKIEKPKPTVNIISTASDFDELINEIKTKGIDITNGYDNWLSVGFALAEEFGEYGRAYFHDVSSVNPEYDYQKTDYQFTHCLRSDNGDKIGIGTFYYFCKNQGLQISSKRTQEAVNIISVKRTHDKGKEEALKSISHLEIEEEEAKKLVEDVYNSPVNRQFIENLPLAERVEIYLTNSYDLKLNEMGNFIECDGEPMDKRKLNQIWIEVLKYIDEKTPKNLVESCLDSEKIETYNPAKDWLESNYQRRKESINVDIINELADCLPSNTWLGKTAPTEYKRTYLKKWLVAMIGGIYGEPNSFVLALIGKEGGTGKTEFIRRLVPKPLRRFYDESPIDSMNGRDNIIKMVKNILIFDDETTSKNFKEYQKFKAITSSKEVRLRKLYSNYEETLLRVCSFAITSNETDIIKDPTGNRRIIPIEVNGMIDRDKYNSIDKEEVFLAAFKLREEGFNPALTDEELKEFKAAFDEYNEFDMDSEFIKIYVEPGEYKVPVSILYRYVTIEAGTTGDRISKNYFAKKLVNLGFEQFRSKKARGFCVSEATAKKAAIGVEFNSFETVNPNEASGGKRF